MTSVPLWSNKVDLFDNGTYSVIWGNFDNSNEKSLGVRWNGEGRSVGFPRRENNPLWYVEPNFLTKPILLELYYQVLKNSSCGNLAKIQQALSEINV